MPQMANITVKKADGTTDVVYTAQAPSSGDSTPAVFRVDTASTRQGNRPVLTLRTQNNGNRNGRAVRLKLDFPILEMTNSIETVTARVPFELTATLPTNVPSDLVKEAIYQFGNLVVSTLIRQSLESGYAPS